MKKNPIAALLVTLLFISALMTAFLATRYFFTIRSLKKMQMQVTAVQQSRSVIQKLALEAVEYSKRDASIDPILIKFEIKGKTESGRVLPPSKPLKP